MELLADFLDYAKTYYTDAEGKLTRSYQRCQETAKIMNELYGDTLVEEFTSARFKTFKKQLIAKDRCRTSINHLLDQTRRTFKWRAGEGLVNADNRLSGVSENRLDAFDRTKLPVAVRMRRSRQSLDIASQRIFSFAQPLTDGAV